MWSFNTPNSGSGDFSLKEDMHVALFWLVIPDVWETKKKNNYYYFNRGLIGVPINH